MTYTLGIEESLKKIFGGILVGELQSDNPDYNNIIKACAINQARFIGSFPSNIFSDEYAIFYDIIARNGIKVFSKNQLNAVIDNSKDLVLDSPLIDLTRLSRVDNGNQTTDDDIIEAVKRNMDEILVELSNRYVPDNEFNSSCIIFIEYFKNTYMTETAHHMVQIMSKDGYTERKTNKRTVKYQGLEQAQQYYNERMRILKEVSDTDRVRNTVVDMEFYLAEQQKEASLVGEDGKVRDDKALMSVGITKVDMMLGELRRSNMLGILGPPKGGKTRFSAFLADRALSLGLNVCIWPLEGTREEWYSMLIAAYIARKNPGIEIDSRSILSNALADAQQRSLVNAAKFEMVSDPHFGRLSFIESLAYVEDFTQVLEAHYNNDNPFDVVVIDSLVNILSRTGRGKVDRISSAYMEFKGFISHGLRRPVLAIVPAQLKQDTVDFLRKNPNETIDVTAGGESAETIRSPDEIIGLFSTKAERAAGYMKLYSVASRHSGNFDDTQIRASLKCCHFYDE